MKQVNSESASALSLLEKESEQMTANLRALSTVEQRVGAHLTEIKTKNQKHGQTRQTFESDILLKKKEMKELVMERRNISETVNVKVLNGISIDLKLSKAHEIFKWCLTFLYK
jgi:hypothetical protein